MGLSEALERVVNSELTAGDVESVRALVLGTELCLNIEYILSKYSIHKLYFSWGDFFTKVKRFCVF